MERIKICSWESVDSCLLPRMDNRKLKGTDLIHGDGANRQTGSEVTPSISVSTSMYTLV